MYVCMSVRNRFTIEIYGFTHSLHTFVAHAAHDAIARNVGQGLRGQKSTPEQVQGHGRRLTAQQKDERRQNNGDRRRLAHQFPSDLLYSMTSERDRRRIVKRHLDCASSFAISNFPCALREAHDAHVYTYLVNKLLDANADRKLGKSRSRECLN